MSYTTHSTVFWLRRVSAVRLELKPKCKQRPRFQNCIRRTAVHILSPKQTSHIQSSNEYPKPFTFNPQTKRSNKQTIEHKHTKRIDVFICKAQTLSRSSQRYKKQQSGRRWILQLHACTNYTAIETCLLYKKHRYRRQWILRLYACTNYNSHRSRLPSACSGAIFGDQRRTFD